jgi:hypothetical protein
MSHAALAAWAAGMGLPLLSPDLLGSSEPLPALWAYYPPDPCIQYA